MVGHHPVFARLYPVMGKAMERGGMDQRRQALLTGLSGEVVEVGAGDGLNFPHYPPSVARVLAAEPEPHLRCLAGEAASRAPVPAEVVDGVAERLPFIDASADTVVVSLVLCSAADQAAALREIRRVLDATLWPRGPVPVSRGPHAGFLPHPRHRHTWRLKAGPGGPVHPAPDHGGSTRSHFLGFGFDEFLHPAEAAFDHRGVHRGIHGRNVEIDGHSGTGPLVQRLQG